MQTEILEGNNIHIFVLLLLLCTFVITFYMIVRNINFYYSIIQSYIAYTMSVFQLKRLLLYDFKNSY